MHAQDVYELINMYSESTDKYTYTFLILLDFGRSLSLSYALRLIHLLPHLW